MGSIGGRVTGRDGEPVAGATVMITDSSAPHPDIAQITDRTGSFRFDGLPAGGYTVAARLPDGRRATGSFTLTGDQRLEQDLIVDA